MPSHTKSHTHQVPGTRIMPVLYGTIDQLGWHIKETGDDYFLIRTSDKWQTGEVVFIRNEGYNLNIESRPINDEQLVDPFSKNKKNVIRFIELFETMSTSATESDIQLWEAQLSLERSRTGIEKTELEREEEQIKELVKGNSGTPYITYALIGVNVLIFVLMVINGVSLFKPTSLEIYTWGGNFGPATLGGEWYRLFTSCFVHIGIIHLVLNMYALLMVGTYLEVLIGKSRFLLGYICSGILASLFSLWWHNEPVVSAGASGAIFGTYGLFLALLTTSLIPPSTRNKLLQSIGVFIAYNLFYGMKAGVDNAAHIGGLVSGFMAGYILLISIRRSTMKALSYSLLVVLTLGISSLYVMNNEDRFVLEDIGQTTEVSYEADPDEIPVNEVFRTTNTDEERYSDIYHDIYRLENKAFDIMNADDKTHLLEEMQTAVLPLWVSAKERLDSAAVLNLNGSYAEHRRLMINYIMLRQEEAALMISELKEGSRESERRALTEKINAITNALPNLR